MMSLNCDSDGGTSRLRIRIAASARNASHPSREWSFVDPRLSTHVVNLCAGDFPAAEDVDVRICRAIPVFGHGWNIALLPP